MVENFKYEFRLTLAESYYSRSINHIHPLCDPARVGFSPFINIKQSLISQGSFQSGIPPRLQRSLIMVENFKYEFRLTLAESQYSRPLNHIHPFMRPCQGRFFTIYLYQTKSDPSGIISIRHNTKTSEKSDLSTVSF